MADKPSDARACPADSSHSYQSFHQHYEHQQLTMETDGAEESEHQPPTIHVAAVGEPGTCVTADSRSVAAPALSCHTNDVPVPPGTNNDVSTNSVAGTGANQTQSEACEDMETNSTSTDTRTDTAQSKVEDNAALSNNSDTQTQSNVNLQSQTGSGSTCILQAHPQTTDEDSKPITSDDGNNGEPQRAPEPPLTEFQKKVNHFFKTHGHQVYDKITKKYDTYFIIPSLEETKGTLLLPLDVAYCLYVYGHVTCHVTIDLFTQTDTAPIECYMGISAERRKERMFQVHSLCKQLYCVMLCDSCVCYAVLLLSCAVFLVITVGFFFWRFGPRIC